MKESEKKWIEIGYRTFAYDGPNSIKIIRMAQKLNKSKSSFYHLFGNLEIFTQRLLDFHLEQAKCIVIKESNAKNEKELIEVLIQHKIDLLFNRQLRFHRETSIFENCFNEINQISFPALVPLWKEIIGLSDNSYLAEMVLALSIDNFYLQITESTLNEEWLKFYFKSIRDMISHFRLKI